MAVPSNETQLLGTKKVSDLVENLSIEGDNVTGTLKHIENWSEFSTDPTDNTGNFIPLYFEEAKGKPRGTVKIELKGTGAVVKKPVDVDPSDGLMVVHIHNNDNTIEITSEGKETRTLTLTDLVLLKPVEVAVPSDETNIIGTNKKAKDIQTGIQISGDKITGTSKHVSGITGAGGDGNYLVLELPQAKDRGNTVKCQFEGGDVITLSTTDYQYLIKLNEKKPVTITITGKVEATRTLDISGVTLGQASEAA